MAAVLVNSFVTDPIPKRVESGCAGRFASTSAHP
jgi:hypothetical protein